MTPLRVRIVCLIWVVLTILSVTNDYLFFVAPINNIAVCVLLMLIAYFTTYDD